MADFKNISEEKTTTEITDSEKVSNEDIADEAPVRKRPTTCAEENAKYTVTPEERLGDTEEYKAYTSTKPRSKVRKRKQMLPVIAILCAIIAVGTLILSNVVKNLSTVYVDNIDAEMQSSSGAKPTPDDGLAIPTPDPEEGDAQEPSIVLMSKDKSKGEHYVFHVADVSWTKAKELAEEAGGHLVTISDQKELDEIITLTMMNDCNYVWIGCHRENDKLVWENGEEIDYYVWGDGEPSKYDKGDKAAEDYVLLWKFNGRWVYNDSRNDPCEEFSDMYSGRIGYVVEFDDFE